MRSLQVSKSFARNIKVQVDEETSQSKFTPTPTVSPEDSQFVDEIFLH